MGWRCCNSIRAHPTVKHLKNAFNPAADGASSARLSVTPLRMIGMQNSRSAFS
jgi:hypothetical protein